MLKTLQQDGHHSVLKFSIITSDNGSLGKSIDLNDDDKLIKNHSSPMSRGSVRTYSIKLDELPVVLAKMKKNQALVHGTVKGSSKGDSFNVVAAKDQSDSPKLNQVSRTKEYFEYSGVHLAMLDHDPDAQCPNDYLEPPMLLRVLGDIDSQWKGVEHIAAMSSSAGLMLDRTPVNKGNGGYHLYFQADDAEQLEDYMTAIFKLSVIAGHGWIKLGGNGAMLVRSCFDNAVFSPERIDFTAPPTLLSDRLTQYRTEPIYTPGGVIDCSKPPDVNEEKYASAVAKLKADPDIITRAEEVKGKRAEVIAKKRNISVNEAMRVVHNNINGDLSCDDEIVFQKYGTVTVIDILKNMQKYDHESCADPSEPEAGTTRAMFFANEGESPLIHSMLHGGVKYFLPTDSGKIKIKRVHVSAKLEPIHPLDFSDMLQTRILYLEPRFKFGKQMIEWFRYGGATYNDVIFLNTSGKKPKRLVLPAPTGAGKSVSSQLYLSKLPSLGFSGLLVVGKITSAIEATKQINKMAGKVIAACTYFPDKKHPEVSEHCFVKNLNKFSIIVITHSMFITRSSTLHDIDNFSLFNGKQRSCVIIDEKIDFERTVSFTNEELNAAKGYVKGIKCWDTIEEILNIFSAYKPKSKADTALQNDLAPFIRCVMDEIRSGKGIIGTTFDRKDPAGELKRRRNIINLLDKMTYVLGGSNIITQQGKLVTYSRNQDLTNQFGSAVILDATANVTPIYLAHALNRNDIKNFALPDGIRDYSNAVLNVCKDKNRGQSKHKIVGSHKNNASRDKTVEDYLQELYALVADGSKLLAVTYIAIVEVFRARCKDVNITFIHWGEHDGRNDFSSYSKAVAIGWYRKSDTKYLNDIDSIQVNTRNYYPLKQTMQNDVRFMVRSGVAADMVQFFNRTRSRIAIDKDGNCAPVNFYIFDDGTVDCPVELIQQELPGIKIKSWVPVKKACKKKSTKATLKAEKIVKFLMKHQGETVTLPMVATHMGCTVKTVNRIIKQNVFQALMAENEIQLIQGRGRGSVTHFDIPEVFESQLETTRDSNRESEKRSRQFRQIFNKGTP